MRKSKLSEEQLQAMRLVKRGADVYASDIAGTLREIEREHPGLVDIGKPRMYAGDGADQVPYFGAICTPAGIIALSCATARRGQ